MSIETMTKQKMDMQQIGLIGKHILLEKLIDANFEVAQPIRDHGIDLIICNDKDQFQTWPIQLKTASEESFSLDEKYKSFPNLRFVYAWKITKRSNAEFYVLTYKQAFCAFKAAQKRGDFEKSDSWKNHKSYSTTKPSAELKKELAKYKVKTKEDWQK